MNISMSVLTLEPSDNVYRHPRSELSERFLGYMEGWSGKSIPEDHT